MTSRQHHKRSRSESSIEHLELHSDTVHLADISRGLDGYIQDIGEPTNNFQNIVGAGFPPKTLSGMVSSRATPANQLILEQQTNFRIITAIILHAYLSQLMILMQWIITSNIEISTEGASSAMPDGNHYLMEKSAQEKRCDEIIKTLSSLLVKAEELPDYVIIDVDKRYVKMIVQQFEGFRPVPSPTLYETIQSMIQRISSRLTSVNINPSMETMEFAVSCLNFDIFYRCLIVDSKAVFTYKRFYANLQTKHRKHETRDYITTLHRGDRGERDDDHSLYLYFYENIHNIAYNVFYNHEYVLPLDCARDFTRMVKHLKIETDIPLGERVPGPNPVSNPFEPNSQVTVTDTGSGSEDYASSFQGSTSPAAARGHNPPENTVLATGGPAGNGSRPSDGGSSRTHTNTHTRRRPRPKQTQTQKKQTRRRRRRDKKRSGK